MKKTKGLSLEELKSRSLIGRNIMANIEAIRGGADDEYCHEGNGKPSQQEVNQMSQSPSYKLQDVHSYFNQFISEHRLR